jgi:hypothetical protein
MSLIFLWTVQFFVVNLIYVAEFCQLAYKNQDLHIFSNLWINSVVYLFKEIYVLRAANNIFSCMFPYV